MRIHNYMGKSKVNGPGTRFVLWVQGCSIRCPGCFNPKTHDENAGEEKEIPQIINLISNVISEIDGISVSGGEPFDQWEDLFIFITSFKFHYPKKNVVVFTGYDYETLKSNHEFNLVLKKIDMLISGPYVESLKVDEDGLIASSNQKVTLLNDVFVGQLIQGGIECSIDEKTGDMTCTGFPVAELLQDEI